MLLCFSEGSVEKKAHLLLLMNAGQQKKPESKAVGRREMFRSW
jgi:hypothetical protein